MPRQTAPTALPAEERSRANASLALPASAIERCWKKAAAPAEWNLSPEQFSHALAASAAHRFGSDARPSDAQIETYLGSLRAPDLALAAACRAGSAAAWEFFVLQYRQELYRAARAIVGGAGANEAGARELADLLYGDLYGLRETDQGRKSLFEYFHGRSKLSTWLRAVLAQRHVDEIRRTRRLENIEDENGGERPLDVAPSGAAKHNEPVDPDREQNLAAMQSAMTAALGGLEPRDRLRLAYYYADERTLAEIGHMLGEHEATVSRKLDRTRRALRQAVESSLRDQKKMTGAQVEACLACASEAWPFDLTGALRGVSKPDTG